MQSGMVRRKNIHAIPADTQYCLKSNLEYFENLTGLEKMRSVAKRCLVFKILYGKPLKQIL